MPGYQVFISRKKLNSDGSPTQEVAISVELYEHLNKIGIRTFLDDVSLIEHGAGGFKRVIDDALDSAKVLIAIGTSRDNLESEWVRYEWDSFFNDMISNVKPGAQVISLVAGMKPAELPRALRQSQSFDYENDGIARIGEFLLRALDIQPVKDVIDNKPGRFRHTPVDTPTIMDTAVLFVDIAGSSRLFKELGHKVAARLLSKAIRDWSQITERNFGWVVKSIGDEIMCGFDSAEDALLAACEIREEIALGLRGESIRIDVKMGFSFGEANRLPDDEVFGAAVNLAARMTGLAQPGQIITSQPTVDSLPEALQARCQTLGETQVKGYDNPITYFAVT